MADRDADFDPDRDRLVAVALFLVAGLRPADVFAFLPELLEREEEEGDRLGLEPVRVDVDRDPVGRFAADFDRAPDFDDERFAGDERFADDERFAGDELFPCCAEEDEEPFVSSLRGDEPCPWPDEPSVADRS